MKLSLTAFLAVAATAVLAGSASASPARSASLQIQHERVGCHSWALNGGTPGVAQKLTLARGGTVSILNNDLMPHRLVQLSGKKISFVNLKGAMGAMGMHIATVAGNMTYMGAGTKLVFPSAGTYTFTTKAGEDYPAAGNVKTVGEDHVLKLTVVVN